MTRQLSNARRIFAVSLAILTQCFAFDYTFAQSKDDDFALVYEPRTVISTAFSAIINPKTATVASSDVQDNELVIGVEIDGKARAYPINQLTGPRREIINDELAGIAIAATW